MPTRLTGIASGLDTASIIESLMQGHKTKVDTAKNDKKKLQWKKEAWSSLNTKLYSFYTGALSKFKSVGTYKAKKVSSTNDKAVTVNASNNAVTGTHTLSVKQVASSQYLTSANLKTKFPNGVKTTSYVSAGSSDTIGNLKDAQGNPIDLRGKSFTVTSGEESWTVEIDSNLSDTTVINADTDDNSSIIERINQQLSGSGLTAEYVDGALKFTNSGDNAFTITAGKQTSSDEEKADSAKAFGINSSGVTVEAGNGTSATLGKAFHVKSVAESEAAITGSTKLTDMNIANGTVFSIKVKNVEKAYEVKIDQNTTLAGLASELSKNGIVANYDEKQGTFFLNSTESGEDYGFEISSNDNNAALGILGLNVNDIMDENDNVLYSAAAKEIKAQDAIVKYNGAEFRQSSNNFSLNGLNFTVNDVTMETDKYGEEIEGTDNPIKLTVSTDTDTIYNAVKDFVKEYNALIKEMNTLYNADSAKDYDMLTDEKKEAMSEDEVKDWEDKIKASLLRRDSTISTLLSTMRNTLNKGVNYTGSDGNEKRYSLASFGIVTGEWSELGQLHIEGDSDDTSYSGNTDKLRAAIENNPDALIQTLSTLGSDLYSSFQKAMKSSELSSALTFYNDKQLDSEIKSYDDKISTLTKKMNNAEDKYYKQFAAMESAMAAMQAQQSSLAGLLGS